MKTASVVELKTHLGHYLGLVSRGETIVVTSHRHPVACLVRSPMGRADGVQMIPPDDPKADVRRISPVRLSRPVDAVQDLLADRSRR